MNILESLITQNTDDFNSKIKEMNTIETLKTELEIARKNIKKIEKERDELCEKLDNIANKIDEAIQILNCEI